MPANTEHLSHGDDLFLLPVGTSVNHSEPSGLRTFGRHWVQVSLTWNSMTPAIGPLLYDENHESELREAIVRWLWAYEQAPLKTGLLAAQANGEEYATNPDLRLT